MNDKSKLLLIFKAYLYLNGKSTAKQFETWLIGKELGLRRSYNAREISGIVLAKRNDPIARPIMWSINSDGINEYYMREKL